MQFIQLLNEQFAYQRKPLRHEIQILAIISKTKGNADRGTGEKIPPQALNAAPSLREEERESKEKKKENPNIKREM